MTEYVCTERVMCTGLTHTRSCIDTNAAARAQVERGEKPDNNRIRLYCDYQLMSDEPPLIWADIVFGDAKTHGVIADYHVLATAEGPFELAYLIFTIDVRFGDGPPYLGGDKFTSDMTHAQALATGQTFLDGLIGDDAECRFATGIEVTE